MKKLIELETDKDFEEFSEILSKVNNGNLLATLKQAIKRPDGNYSFVDLQQNMSESKAIVQINGDYVYITVREMRRAATYKIKNMFNTVLQRGTRRYAKGEENDYVLVLDVGRDESETKGLVYLISAVSPIMVSNDGDTDLTFVFALEDVRCSKDEVSIYDIDYEVDSTSDAERELVENDLDGYESEYEEEEFEENEDILGNDDILSNDEYTEVSE